MNCEGNRYDINLGCCELVLGPVENYYTKTQVDKLIENIDVSGVTEEEVDEKIASAKSEIEAEIPSLSGYVTENDLTSYTYDKQTIDNKIGDKLDTSAYTPTDLSNYDTKSEVNDKISSAVTEVNNALTGHTSNNDVHVTTAQTAAWDAKPSVWMGTEQEWQAISGNTQQGIIYMVTN
jgi:hypothetical protein